jgi:hypothetical protein
MMWIIDIVLDYLSASISRSAEEITPTPKARKFAQAREFLSQVSGCSTLKCFYYQVNRVSRLDLKKEVNIVWGYLKRPNMPTFFAG